MIIIKMIRKCSECSNDSLLIEIDKNTFVEYDSFIYQCKNGHRYGELMPKDCTDCRIKKDKINLNNILIIKNCNECVD